MKQMDKETLKIVANNLLFDMEEIEYERIFKQFAIIQQQMNFLNKVEGLENVEPMDYPFEVKGELREDIPVSCNDREAILKNLNDVEDGKIRLPKVVR